MEPASATSASLDALLPQTQCRRCGFAGCAPYADAMARGEADINRCPPGGDATVAALAGMTGRPVRPIDPDCGASAPLWLAVIDEPRCIGCTLCIAACPVDAILGAARRMHAVVASLCSGCELCVAPCPVDCIVMKPAGRTWTATDARSARERHDARAYRLMHAERVASRDDARTGTATSDPPSTRPRSVDAGRAAPQPLEPMTPSATEAGSLLDPAAARRRAVEAALARARARRHAA